MMDRLLICLYSMNELHDLLLIYKYKHTYFSQS